MTDKEVVETEVPVLGVLATIYSDKGAMIGPLAPTQIEIKPYGDKFSIVLTFEKLWDGPDTTFTHATFIVANMVRHRALNFPAAVRKNDVFTVHYSMNVTSVDEPADDPKLTWSQRLLSARWPR